MDEKNQKQVLEVIDQAKTIALALPESPSLDAAATAAALFHVLTQNGKAVTVLLDEPFPEKLDFLGADLSVKNSLPSAKGLEVRVSTAHAQLEQLSYTIEDDSVRIFLQAKNGEFQPTDIIARQPGPAVDLIITVGASSLEDLGNIYNANVDLFFATPKLAIDTNPENSYFGTTHLIEVTASSLGEVVGYLFLEQRPENLDAHTATALLAAITAATHSFQSIKTTPHTLSLAAELVNRGAQQQEVVLHLYKTKPFPLLKLWGRALARTQIIEQPSLLYSELTLVDFEKTGTVPELAESVLLELLDNSANAHSVAIASESPDGVRVYLASLPHVQQQAAMEALGGRVLHTRKLKGLYVLQIIQLSTRDVSQVLSQLIQALSQ